MGHPEHWHCLRAIAAHALPQHRYSRHSSAGVSRPSDPACWRCVLRRLITGHVHAGQRGRARRDAQRAQKWALIRKITCQIADPMLLPHPVCREAGACETDNARGQRTQEKRPKNPPKEARECTKRGQRIHQSPRGQACMHACTHARMHKATHKITEGGK